MEREFYALQMLTGQAAVAGAKDVKLPDLREFRAEFDAKLMEPVRRG